MVIAHLTDLHVSKYGIRMSELSAGRYRAATGAGWEPVWSSQGWRIDVRWAAGRTRWRDAYRLVDGEDRVHELLKDRNESGGHRLLDRLKRLREIRLKTSCAALARRRPNAAELEWLLREDPRNGNLRFCALAETLRRDRPDWLIITGDLTDDGEGYELLLAGLAPFIQERRLICIPGNHDVYATPPVWNDARFLKTESKKREAWEQFNCRLILPNPQGCLQPLGEGVVLARLDSCHASRIPGSTSGRVSEEQLQVLEQELSQVGRKVLRFACLHHSLLNPAKQGLGLVAFQPGMKLRNSRRTLKRMARLGIALVMNGHRHVGYKHQAPEGPLMVSAPSSTYGCRTGVKPFYWRLEALHTALHSIHQRFIPSLVAV